MKLTHDKDADVAYLYIRGDDTSAPEVASLVEVAPGIILDFDDQ
ncbi:DUF2283 domain-containing protein [Pantanalinema sp. GBBB05]|nr:DUF2283 domain-containing protein [Pantanalinema sp. GBBB05]